MRKSFRSFRAFFGSGLIVSVAYMDPGNWGTNIEAGASFEYDLLWVIWMASGMAMLFQYLSGKLGICGYSLPELVQKKIRHRGLLFFYWFLSEIAILATDLAEFLGIVVALHLLFGIPLLFGAVIAIFDVLLLILLTQERFRLLEQSFILFVAIIGIAFLYEVILSKPDFAPLLIHSIQPTLDSKRIFVAVGIIGATVMPHALFVHSWLIKNKVLRFPHFNGAKKLRFHLWDNVISLIVAGFINASMLIMAAAAFYQSGYEVATLEDAYRTLTPLFGSFASLIFAIALLSAGISSSVTGTLAGQSLMEALTPFRVSIWVRRLITRFLNLIPLLIALILHIEPLRILVVSQVTLSLLIPLPLIPLLIFTSDRKIMQNFVNRKVTTVFASLFAVVILGFNGYFLFSLL